MNSVKLINELTKIYGLSGHESSVFSYLSNNIASDYYNDNLGSFISEIKGRGKKNIAIVAHMDEVGFLLKNIDEDGFCSFVNVGGINETTLVSQTLVLINRNGTKYEGIVLSVPPHLMQDTKLDLNSLVIDFGFKSKQEAISAGLELGNPIYFKADFYSINDTIMSKALDNRLGCALICELYEYFSKNIVDANMYFIATVQEEVGLRGAQTVLNKIEQHIDYVVVVDVSPVVDNIEKTGAKLGNGCLLRIKDPRTLLDYEELNQFRDLANEKNIKYQEYYSKGGTDASNLQVHGSGHKTSAICVGARNIHSNRAVCDINDYYCARDLIIEYVRSKNDTF